MSKRKIDSFDEFFSEEVINQYPTLDKEYITLIDQLGKIDTHIERFNSDYVEIILEQLIEISSSCDYVEIQALVGTLQEEVESMKFNLDEFKTPRN